MLMLPFTTVVYEHEWCAEYWKFKNISLSNNVNYNNYNHYYDIIIISITVKPLLSGHLRDLPKCLLNRGFKICTMFVNDQHLTVTLVKKLHVVKEAIQSSSSLPFITNFNLFVNAKTLTDFSKYFKYVIQYYYCQFSPASA